MICDRIFYIYICKTTQNLGRSAGNHVARHGVCCGMQVAGSGVGYDQEDGFILGGVAGR